MIVLRNGLFSEDVDPISLGAGASGVGLLGAGGYLLGTSGEKSYRKRLKRGNEKINNEIKSSRSREAVEIGEAVNRNSEKVAAKEAAAERAKRIHAEKGNRISRYFKERRIDKNIESKKKKLAKELNKEKANIRTSYEATRKGLQDKASRLPETIRRQLRGRKILGGSLAGLGLGLGALAGYRTYKNRKQENTNVRR